MYFYNTDTGALHIKSFCGQSSPYPNHVKFFESEKDAYDFAGQKIYMCETCQRKRDELLRKHLNK